MENRQKDKGNIANVFEEARQRRTFLEMAEKMFSHHNFIQIVMIYQQEFNCNYDVGARGVPGPKGCMVYPDTASPIPKSEMTSSIDPENSKGE